MILKLISVFLLLICHKANSFSSYGLYKRDVDIQDSVIGIISTLERNCPIVLIYDEILPRPAASRILLQFENQGLDWLPVFIILDLSKHNLQNLIPIYGTSDPVDVLLHFLHILYRQSECYTFIIWISDPRILQTNSASSTHPGWRQTDVVLLTTHHITKRYKSLIREQFWFSIPNIIGLKRKNDDDRVSNEVRIFTVLPYFSNKRQKSQELDVWLVQEQEFLYNRQLFFDKFKTFNWASLNIGLFWKEPFLIWGNYENPYFDGLDWRLLVMCLKSLNFSFTSVNTVRFGRKTGNSSWSGMMGMLRDNLIDIGVGGVAMYSERMEDFGFTKSYYNDPYTFISPINDKVAASWNALSRPFQDEVWITAGVTIFFASFCLRIMASLEFKLLEKGSCNQRRDSDKHFRSSLNIIGFVITLICQKSYRCAPKQLPLQFVFYGIILCNFILGILFSSCLMAYLIKLKHKPLAEKVEDILKARVKIRIRDYDGYLQEFMENSKDPIISEIRQLSTLEEWNSTMDDVVLGKAIQIDSLSRIKFVGRYRYMGAKGLKFHIGLDNILDHVAIGWPVRKNWPFTKKFNDIINRAVENGFVQFWMKRFMQGQFGWDGEAWKIPELKYLNERAQSVNDIDPSLILDQRFVPLSLSHLYGVTSLYIVGVTLAVYSFLIELFFSCLHRTGRRLIGCCFKKVKPTLQNLPQSQISNSHAITIKPGGRNKEGKNRCKKQKSHLTNLPEILWADFDSCEKKFANRKNPKQRKRKLV